jgi:Uma2 family endonuclease
MLAHEVLIPPDLAVEIVSPGQSRRELRDRCRWYVSNGVEIAILVDLAHQSVLTFRADGAIDELHGAERIDISAGIPDFELSVQDLFSSLRAR